MDMWEPYANSMRAHLDDADNKIVFDPLWRVLHNRSYVLQRIMGPSGTSSLAADGLAVFGST
jgi:hypothetical protein